MARFSPTRRVQTTVPGVFDALNELIDRGGENVENRRQRDLEDEQIGIGRENRELDLHEAGVRRGTAPTVPIPEERDVFAGAPRPGMAGQEQPDVGIFGGEGIGMQPDRTQTPADAALGQIAEQGVPAEPRILALPGAFVEGMGFSPGVLTDQDLVEESRRRNAVQRTETAPGFDQVSDELFIDRAATPEGRERTATSERDQQDQARLASVLGALEADPDNPDVQAAAISAGLSERAALGQQDQQTITVMGREFPDTPTGERAALAWREAIGEAGRSPNASGDGTRITGEVTRRALATAAARALQGIREDVAGLSPRERRNLQAGQIETQIRTTLELFGFDSPDELQNEMRTLRLSGTGGAPTGPSTSSAAGGAPGADEPALTDAQIDELIRANPDMTDAEILQLIGGG